MNREIPYSKISWRHPHRLFRGTSIAFIEDSILKHMSRGAVAYSGWQNMPTDRYPDADITFASPSPQDAVLYAKHGCEWYKHNFRGYFCAKLEHSPALMEITITPETKIYRMEDHDGLVITGRINLDNIMLHFAPGIDTLGCIREIDFTLVAKYFRGSTSRIKTALERLTDGDTELKEEAQIHLLQSGFSIEAYLLVLQRLYNSALREDLKQPRNNKALVAP
ncbi:hypothetical protein HY641_01305 [Candidatus Woesearchaeota archaeon]|nr:hypothetical protein [Candidatus Woesearchaeota archaeon]